MSEQTMNEHTMSEHQTISEYNNTLQYYSVYVDNNIVYIPAVVKIPCNQKSTFLTFEHS